VIVKPGADCGAAKRALLDALQRGEKAMRFIFALSFSIALCASANASTVHHVHHRHLAVRPSQSLILSPVPGWAYAPAGRAVQPQPAPEYDQTPDVYNRYPNWGG
jgi:hypothetical protein